MLLSILTGNVIEYTQHNGTFNRAVSIRKIKYEYRSKNLQRIT
jgi:hypothetical protein